MDDPITELPILQWLEQEYASFGVDVARQQTDDEALPTQDAMIRGLHRRIDQLEQMLHGALAAQAADALFSGPLREVFLAQKTSDKQYKQRIPEDGVLVDFTDGIVVTDDADPAAFILMDADHVVVVAVRDANGKRIGYVPISGGGTESVGQYQFMVHSMVSQNVGGWDVVDASPPMPP